MNEKHINKSLCESDSTKNPPPCEIESQVSPPLRKTESKLSPLVREAESKSPLPCGGGLGVGKIGYKQTSIGIIPQDWEVVRLGEVGDIVGGGTPDTTNPAFWNGEIAWISSSDIDEESIYRISTRRFINEFAIKNSATNLIPAKSVLIISRVGVGKVAVNENPLCTSQDTQSLIPNNDNYIFMAYLVKFNIRKLLQYNQGTSIKGFTKTELKSLQIPLPPLKEQEKIARILGVWDSAIDSLANLIKAKRKYKTALMQRLLTPPRYTTSCHTERSEVSKSKSVDFVDTSAFSKPQYDKVLDSCNDTPLCHTASSSCHTEGVARSIQKDDLQGNDICLDSSLSAKAQNDKEKNAENGREINPQNDKENTHNDKKKICESSLRFAGFSDKWQEFRLGDLLQYEQPTKYIVKNTEYSDSYQTPVLTAGKSFILGKTNETFGIYDDLPIILFDDFMATSQFVDFPFKVKSSASKILKAKNNSVNLRVVFEVMQMIDFCAENHKRYWISEYQNLKIKLPTLAEQKKIAQILSVCDKEIETLNLKFECLKAQKRGLMQQLLSGKVRVKI